VVLSNNYEQRSLVDDCLLVRYFENIFKTAFKFVILAYFSETALRLSVELFVVFNDCNFSES